VKLTLSSEGRGCVKNHSDFDGYLAVDGLESYDVLKVAKGRCNGHLLRRCKELHDVVWAKEQTYLESLSALLQQAIDLARRREALTPAGYACRVQEIENRLDDWLDGLPRSVSPELDRLDNHIRAHRGEWLLFLHDPEVPPTNNHAEQLLRPAVITRKVGGCNKTLGRRCGGDTHHHEPGRPDDHPGDVKQGGAPARPARACLQT
jgi:transposase